VRLTPTSKSPRRSAGLVSRRRTSLRAYLRRRWRAIGLVVVIALGALLVLALADRGHDPVWSASGSGSIGGLAVADHGEMVYSLVRDGNNVTRLEARTGSDGELLWASPVESPRARLATDGAGVVVATDLPRPFLTAFAPDGAVRYQRPLDGGLQALAADQGRVAVALQAAGEPVVIYENGTLVARYTFPALVEALALRSGHLAVATADDVVHLWRADDRLMLEERAPLGIRAMALSADGSSVVVGGIAPGSAGLLGAVAYYDATSLPARRWNATLSAAVSIIDVDRPATRVLAVTESRPTSEMVILRGVDGMREARYEIAGAVPHEQAGAERAAAISPDGQWLAARGIRAPVMVWRIGETDATWSFDDAGGTRIVFPKDRPSRFVTDGRFLATNEHDTLFYFALAGQPPVRHLGVLALSVALAVSVGGFGYVALGYWRLRRSVR